METWQIFSIAVIIWVLIIECNLPRQMNNFLDEVIEKAYRSFFPSSEEIQEETT